jgi:hypothetical protein
MAKSPQIKHNRLRFGTHVSSPRLGDRSAGGDDYRFSLERRDRIRAYRRLLIKELQWPSE